MRIIIIIIIIIIIFRVGRNIGYIPKGKVGKVGNPAPNRVKSHRRDFKIVYRNRGKISHLSHRNYYNRSKTPPYKKNAEKIKNKNNNLRARLRCFFCGPKLLKSPRLPPWVKPQKRSKINTNILYLFESVKADRLRCF